MCGRTGREKGAPFQVRGEAVNEKGLVWGFAQNLEVTSGWFGSKATYRGGRRD